MTRCDPTPAFEDGRPFWLSGSGDSLGRTYGYDGLHRPTSTTYSAGTPAIGLSYDSTSVSNGKGRRTGMSDGAGNSVFHYDTVGRISKIVRTMTGSGAPPAQTADFVYNAAGGLTQSKWPGIYDNGPTNPLTIYYGYDNAGRQSSAYWSNNGLTFRQLVGPTNGYTFNFYNYTGKSDDDYAREITTFANATVETVTHNLRLQPWKRIVNSYSVLMNFEYAFKKPGTNANNGNV